MYIHYRTTHGFNDIIARIIWFAKLCEASDRILLVDGLRGTYKLDLSNYFTFPQKYIINDSATINRIIKDTPIVTIPRTRPPPLPVAINMLGDSPIVSFKNLRHFKSSYAMFRHLIIKPIVKEECKRRKDLIGDDYLGVQVRNTDYKCDFTALYETNKEVIHKYAAIYLATDCEDVVSFFKSKGLNVFNFATFPPNKRAIHKSNVPGSVQMIDLLCDIYLIGMACTVLSSSSGDFITLMRDCNAHKSALQRQFA